MAGTGNGRVTASDGGGLKDIGHLCENVEWLAREAKFAAIGGDGPDAARLIERLLDEDARLRLGFRAWQAQQGPAVSDSRMSV